MVHARGPALRLGMCLLGFPAVACAVSPIPTIASLCSNRPGFGTSSIPFVPSQRAGTAVSELD